MATAAAAIIAKARRRILDHLMGANAVSADAAVSFEPGTAVQARQLQRMLNAGVVRETGSGKYWVDIPVYRDWADARRRRILVLMIIVIIGAAVGALASVGGIHR